VAASQSHVLAHDAVKESDENQTPSHDIQVISDAGTLLKSYDIREMAKEAGLKFLGRRVDVGA